MDQLSPEKYFSIHSLFSHIPYSQSEDWYNYLVARGENVVFYCNREDQPSIAFMGRIKKVPLVGRILIVEGELISNEISNETITDFYSEVVKLPYAGIEINSNNEYSIEFEVGIRRSGFMRPIGLSSCPLSIIVDLSNDLKYNRNWKYNYNKAIKAELLFDEVTHPELSDLQLFSDMYSELASRKNLGYKLNPKALLSLVNGPNMRLFSVMTKEKVVVASNIIYVRGIHSYDIFASNSNLSWENGATRFIVQKIFEVLKSEGVTVFDFGRIPPSTHGSDGVYKFKNSVKGTKIQYNGEWSFYQKNLKEQLVYLGKHFIAKTQRY
ncbi:hypothetical protein AYK24_03375 [Thermoplasmatales archaeon SG8-52-4]|nr:MAG: hypothetical protein AYK24_03375 [Thermoplasmatales archaeon SG8-52-4]